MNTSHPVTPFNCGCPLRDHTPSPAIHPELSKVNIDGSLISGMIAPINGDAQNEDVYNRKSFLKLNKLIESTPAASPAAGGASERCICLEYIGDNGPCPVHGTRGGAK